MLSSMIGPYHQLWKEMNELILKAIYLKNIYLCGGAMCQGTMWKSKDNLQEPVLSYHVGSRAQTQVIRVGASVLTAAPSLSLYLFIHGSLAVS